MRVVILSPTGGHRTGAVLDLDDASAEWLTVRGYAKPADDTRPPTKRRSRRATSGVGDAPPLEGTKTGSS